MHAQPTFWLNVLARQANVRAGQQSWLKIWHIAGPGGSGRRAPFDKRRANHARSSARAESGAARRSQACPAR